MPVADLTYGLIWLIILGGALAGIALGAYATDWVADRNDSRDDDAWGVEVVAPLDQPGSGLSAMWDLYPDGDPERGEPTDDEIYNGYGREGGIGYDPTDEPGSLGENDWRL